MKPCSVAGGYQSCGGICCPQQRKRVSSRFSPARANLWSHLPLNWIPGPSVSSCLVFPSVRRWPFSPLKTYCPFRKMEAPSYNTAVLYRRECDWLPQRGYSPLTLVTICQGKYRLSITLWPFHWSSFVRCFACTKPMSNLSTALTTYNINSCFITRKIHNCASA